MTAKTLSPDDHAAVPIPTRAPEREAEPTYGIAEVAEQVGITAHTPRYYERIGLLDVSRDAGGRRRYTVDDIARVTFITCLRKADLPISRMQRYFELVESGPHTEPERLDLLERHRGVILTRLDDLQAALETVDRKIEMYGGQPGNPAPASCADTLATTA